MKILFFFLYLLSTQPLFSYYYIHIVENNLHSGFGDYGRDRKEFEYNLNSKYKKNPSRKKELESVYQTLNEAQKVLLRHLKTGDQNHLEELEKICADFKSNRPFHFLKIISNPKVFEKEDFMTTILLSRNEVIRKYFNRLMKIKYILKKKFRAYQFPIEELQYRFHDIESHLNQSHASSWPQHMFHYIYTMAKPLLLMNLIAHLGV